MSEGFFSFNKQVTYLKSIWRGAITENPVLILGLGLCSTLAATTKVENAFFMSLIVGITTIITSVISSSLRYKIPFRFRLLSYMLIIVTTVISAEQLLKVFFPEIAKELGAYVGLVVTNCIVMGRMEAYASSHTLIESFCDALGVSLGYMIVLMSISTTREIIGNGTIWNLSIFSDSYIPCRVFSSPPGAFIIFAIILFIVNWFRSFWQKN